MIPEFLRNAIHWSVVSGREFFEWYNAAGRDFLDFTHLVFNNTFYAFLGVTVVISVLFYVVMIHKLTSKKKTHHYSFDTEKAPYVSIQIPTLNELAALNCAKRCLEFDYPKDKFEILIGDDSNNPEISKKIIEFANAHEQIKVFKRERNVGYKPGNLNNLLKFSNGEILVLFDSDFLPERDFLRRLIAPYQHIPDLSVVQSRWKIINPNTNLITMLGATMSKVFHYFIMPFVKNFGKVSLLCGSAEAIRKKDLIEVGGWLSGSMTEDIECSIRLLLKNKKLIYLEDLECGCEVPHTSKDLYKQQMRWAYGVFSSVKMHWRALMSRRLGFRSKFAIFSFCSGYMFTFLLFTLLLFGTLAFITHPPGPMDLPRFFGEMSRNILLTSGLLIASLVAVIMDKDMARVDKVFMASFSYGLVVTYYVNLGILKVLTGQPMHWHMLKKEGNEINSS
ncbi:glycosyltransferase family 2 protein [Nanoarchaeota archaeon]